MEARLEVDDKLVIESFNRAIQFGANPRRLLNDAGRYGVTSTKLRFRTQLDPDGVRWKPSERAKREGGQTLRDTGRLRNSITWNPLVGGVEWGTNVKYARVHQDGFDGDQKVPSHFRTIKKVYGRKLREPKKVKVRAFTRHMKIPRRRFLGVSSADRLALMQIASEQLRKAVTGSAS